MIKYILSSLLLAQLVHANLKDPVKQFEFTYTGEYNHFVQELADMQYTGRVMRRMVWSTCYNPQGIPYRCQRPVNIPSSEPYFMHSTVSLSFNEDTMSKGRGVRFLLYLRDGKTGVATFGPNVLSIARLLNMQIADEDELRTMDLELDIRFYDLSRNINLPVLSKISDFMIEDDFLNFTIGKVSAPELLNLDLIIQRKTGVFRKEEIFNRRIETKEMDIIEFGDKRSLVSIDLNNILRRIDREKKHIFEIKVSLGSKDWQILNQGTVLDLNKNQTLNKTSKIE